MVPFLFHLCAVVEHSRLADIRQRLEKIINFLGTQFLDCTLLLPSPTNHQSRAVSF